MVHRGWKWYGGAGGDGLWWRMQDHRKLHIWHRAQDFAVRVHQLTEAGTGSAYGAWRSQLRRSAQSIGANIAEGAARGTPKQFGHFLEIAQGSASETESHLDFAMRIGALNTADALSLIDEIGQLQRMIAVLRRKVLEGSR